METARREIQQRFIFENFKSQRTMKLKRNDLVFIDHKKFHKSETFVIIEIKDNKAKAQNILNKYEVASGDVKLFKKIYND